MAHLFTADLHFGHTFVAGLRGFDSAEDHDEFMIEDINRVTHEDDILWILGDIGIRTDDETLDKVGRLNGRKMLISGNHDSTHPMHKNAWKSQARALRVFEYVSPFQRLRLGGEYVLLSHLPYEGDHSEEARYEQYGPRIGAFHFCAGMFMMHGRGAVASGTLGLISALPSTRPTLLSGLR